MKDIIQNIILKYQADKGAIDSAREEMNKLVPNNMVTGNESPVGANPAEEEKIAKEQELFGLLKAQEQIKKNIANVTNKIVKSTATQVKNSDKMVAAEKEAAKLLGITGKATVKQINNKIKEIRGIEKQKGLYNDLQTQLKLIQSGNSGSLSANQRINEQLAKRATLQTALAGTNAEATRLAKEHKLDEKARVGLAKEEAKIKKDIAKTAEDIKTTTKKTLAEQKKQKDVGAALEQSFSKKAISALIYYEAMSSLKRVIRSAVETIKELDVALTDVAVVTSMNRDEAWGLIGVFQEMAKEVGLTATAVTTLSIEFFRQGRELNDVLELTRTAAKLAKIAAIDVQDAANYLTSAINGFGLAASDANRIIDRFAALGAGAAAAADEIALALSKVAPSAKAAGIEIDTMMAFLTKGIETTREAPENIGTAFKTIIARMRQLKDIGVTTEDGISFNKVDTALKHIGVSLTDTNNQFRDLDDVLIDVGQQWSSLDRNTQAYIATTMAGTRQQSRLLAIFENFDRTMELVTISENSAGVAALQHGEYMEGLEAATTRLKTSWQQLITSFVSSNLVIGIVNGINTGLELLNTTLGKLVITMGLVTLARKAWDIKKFVEGRKDFIAGIHATNKMFSAQIVKFKALKISKLSDIALTKKAIVTKKANLIYNNLIDKGFSREIAQRRTMLFLKLRSNQYGMKANLLKLKQIVLDRLVSLGLLQVSTSSTAAAGGITTMNTAIYSVPVLGWILAIVAAFIALFVAIKKINNAVKTTNETTARLQVIFKNIVGMFKWVGDTIKGIVNWFKKMNTSFDTLIEKVEESNPLLATFLKVLRLIKDVVANIIVPFKLWGTIFKGIVKLFVGKQGELEAAFTVTLNSIKEMNAETKKLTKSQTKLTEAYDEYQRLSAIGLKTPEEMAELQVQIDKLEALDPEYVIEGRVSTTAIEESATEIERALADLADGVQDKLSDFFDGTEFKKGSFRELYDGLDAEGRSAARQMAQQQAISYIEGWESYSSQIQSALKFILADSAVELSESADAALKAGTVDSRDEYYDNIAGDVAATDRSFNSLQNADTTAEQTAAIQQLQSLGFSDESMAYLSTYYDDLEYMMNTEQDVLIAALTSTNEDISSVLKKVSSNLHGNVNLDEVLGDLTASDNYLNNLESTLTKIRDGAYEAIQGDDKEGLINSLLGSLDINQLPDITKQLGLIGDELDKLTEMADKDILSLDDINWMVENAPELLDDIIDKNLDIADIEEQRKKSILTRVKIRLDEIEILNENNRIEAVAARNASGLIVQRLQMISLSRPLEENEKAMLNLAQEQFDTALSILELKTDLNDAEAAGLEYVRDNYDELKAEADLRAKILDFSKEEEERITAKYDIELAEVALLKEKIAGAKTLRDLQAEALAYTQASFAAGRTGADTSFEAKFKQDEAQTALDEMNKELEDKIITAQLDAQAQVLQDAKDNALLSSQERVANALETLEGVIVGPDGLIIAIKGNTNAQDSENSESDFRDTYTPSQGKLDHMNKIIEGM
jgi:TP901 family phage tail tape measure protein